MDDKQANPSDLATPDCPFPTHAAVPPCTCCTSDAALARDRAPVVLDHGDHHNMHGYSHAGRAALERQVAAQQYSTSQPLAPSFENHDLRRYCDVEVPREWFAKYVSSVDGCVNSIKALEDPAREICAHQADVIYASFTNLQRLSAELVRYTHEQVGLPVPPDVIELLDHSPAPGRVAAASGTESGGEGGPTRCLKCDNDIETGGCGCDRPVPSSSSSVAHSDLTSFSTPRAV